MIVTLSKIQIIGPKEVLERVIDFLKDKKIIHPEREIESFCGDLKNFLKNYNYGEEAIKERILYESLKRKIEAYLELINVVNVDNLERKEISDISLSLEQIDSDTLDIKNYLKKYEEIKIKKEEIELHLKFLNLTKETFGNELDLSTLEVTGLLLKSQDSAERLRKILEEKGGDLFRLITKGEEKGKIISLIIYPSEIKGELKKYLKDLNIPEMVTPSDITKMSLGEKIKFLDEKFRYLSEQVFLLKKEIVEKISEKKGLYLENLKIVNKRLQQIYDRIYLFKSENLFFIFGWIPKENLEILKEDLKNKFDGNVILEEVEILESEKEKIPVLVQNSEYFKPYEIFTKIFPVPYYTSYDPTIFLGIFFPIFFGIIVGDIGYGFIITIISLVGQRFLKKEFLQKISKVLFYGGLSTILFGIIYGEFFGEIGEEFNFLKNFKIIDRGHSILQMFFLSIFIGVTHIIIGFFLNLIKPAHKKERIATLALIFCIFLLISIIYFLSLGGKEKLIYMLLIILSLLIVLSIIYYGIIFPLELIKAVGNIVSYGRIMAIGLSSVILANVANNFLGAVGNIFIGVLIAIFIHSINIVLSIFSPTIHSLRLHYVEFFSKFMKFGGRKFSPL